MNRHTLLLPVLALAALACKGGSSADDATAAVDPQAGSIPSPAVAAMAAFTGASTAASEDSPGGPIATLERRAAELAPETHERAPGDIQSDHQHGGPHVTGCPVTPGWESDLDILLHQATESYRSNRFGEAYGCAVMAADLAPRSVDAHHLRAAAAAAMGHLDIAQMAYTLALALDPDDPDTLAAASDFFINSVPRSSRESILVGLEYARRGHAIASSRHGVDRGLQARLVLLEAQALNDLGMSQDALTRADQSIALQPAWLEAEHERGVALFNLCRFASARDAFHAVVSGSPDDAYAHYYLGLINERLGLATRSEHHFRRARSLAPEDFWSPVTITADEFRAEVDQAITELPGDLATMLAQVSLELGDLPAMDDLTAVEPPFSPTILGLFRGLPLGMDDASAFVLDDGRPVPDRAIVLYRRNLARIARTRAELDVQIRQTILHELGHLSGLDEDELRRRGLE